ncbi:hypothetical protein MLD38_000617 [Melastoma candidum]|uniref:Uncharacterized protein n=1 Tax=Melastoma candidum TaxID=119954 RepID=A0ACB9SA68_9MYRT|nr:hypothetical protein MLD38_000617 [Melastoma candidum]
MAEQEEKKRSGGSCDGGATGSSKKPKQKKPPQRGLGVAQLERLRLEELQKKDVPFSPSTSFCPSASLPNFPVTIEFKPSGSLFRNIPSFPSTELAALLTPPRSMSNHFLGSNMSSSFLPNQVVGVGHPSLLRYRSEPPSNQIHRGSAPAPFGPQGEMRFGTKRSCHFALDNQPPITCIPFKILKVGNPTTSRPEEPSPFSRVDNLRENFGQGSSHSSSMLGSSSTDSIKENKVNESEYLTLAPPVDDPLHSQHFGSGALRQHNLHPGFEFSQYPADPMGQPMQLPFHRPYYEFVPPKTIPENIENAQDEGGSEDTSESIDLDLKL